MNARIRNVIFWLHLVVGLAAGIVIFIMAATGTLLMYERQITDWADRTYRSTPPAGAARLPVETLIARVLAERPGTPPSSVTLRADPAAPALVSLGRERTLYVNAYTGQILGEGSRQARAFFRGVTGWHRWLGARDERRDLGRKITGACNLGFLILVVSGLYLWLPRKWTRRQVRNVAWFRRGLGGKARDFNWHNVIGLWMWAPLFLVVLSGVVMSYPWANDLLFRLAGDQPPARSPEGSRDRPGRGGRGGEAVSLDGLDPLWERAERQVPGWRSLSLRLPGSGDAPVSFTILGGERGRPDLRAQLTLDRRSGEVVRWEPFAAQSPGRRLRSWARWAHTGEAEGFLGQTLAGLASAGAALLVWTGGAMAWRRFFPGRRRVEKRGTSVTDETYGESHSGEIS
jgi:uncharacterized iron-regulated membrane protein